MKKRVFYARCQRTGKKIPLTEGYFCFEFGDKKWEFVCGDAEETTEYCVPIDDLSASADRMIDWLGHLYEKTWFNPKQFFDFIQRFRRENEIYSNPPTILSYFENPESAENLIKEILLVKKPEKALEIIYEGQRVGIVLLKGSREGFFVPLRPEDKIDLNLESEPLFVAKSPESLEFLNSLVSTLANRGYDFVCVAIE
jgi:hypothetical protein